MSKEDTAQEELNQYLTFILDNEEYGVPILKVSGIQGWEKTTPIPGSDRSRLSAPPIGG